MSAPALDLHWPEVADRTSYDAWLGPWWQVHAAAQRHGREEAATVWTLAELRERFADGAGLDFHQPLVARREGRVVAAGLLSGSLTDNLDTATVELGVAPDHRGRGVGGAVLEALEAHAVARGRTVLQSEVTWPWSADPQGAGVRDLRFATDRGYRLGLVDVQRQLRLPVAASRLDDLAAAAAPHHPSYAVRAWTGPVPEELVASWAELASTLVVEAPVGAMTREAESADVAAHRAREELAARQGRTLWNAAALDPAGTVVAYTELATTVHEPGRAYQGGTLVHPAHRGHRLGTTLKVAVLRLLQDQRPAVRSVRTWNAEANAPMVAVNVALGYEPLERVGELERVVGA